jgi:hypothetical protein
MLTNKVQVEKEPVQQLPLWTKYDSPSFLGQQNDIFPD